MIIRLPEVFLDKGLTDREIVFSAFMWRIRKAHPTAKMYRMYAMDIKTILGCNGKGSPETAMKSLTEFFDVDDVNADIWYVKCKWKREGPIDYVIEDESAIRIWCYLLGRTAGERYLDENPKTMQQFTVERKKVFGSYGHLLDFPEFSQF